MTKKVLVKRRFDLLLNGSPKEKLEAIYASVVKYDRHGTLEFSRVRIEPVGNRSQLRVIGTYTVKGGYPSDLTRRFQRACRRVRSGATVELVYWV